MELRGVPSIFGLITIQIGTCFWFVITNTVESTVGIATIPINVGQGMSALIIVSVVTSYLPVEVSAMIISAIMNQRWYERAVAEGRAQGELNERDFWWNWKNRRLFALSRGEEFNEPVPPHLN